MFGAFLWSFLDLALLPLFIEGINRRTEIIGNVFCNESRVTNMYDGGLGRPRGSGEVGAVLRSPPGVTMTMMTINQPEKTTNQKDRLFLKNIKIF